MDSTTPVPYAIGLDLGGTDLKAARVSRAGVLDAFVSRPSRIADGAQAPLDVIARALDELSGPGLIGVGLGLPGRVDPARGMLVGRTAHLTHWNDLEIGAWLATHTALPVTVDNDANLAALAEATCGAARAARNALTVTLGTGVGAGLVVDGRIVHGATGGAGEIGHLPIGSGEEPCPCGVEGCVEPEIAMGALLRRAHAAGLPVKWVSEVFERADAGDVLAESLVGPACEQLARVIAVAVDLLAPEVVVLAGGGAFAGEALRARVERAIPRYVLPSHAAVRIALAAFPGRSGVIGGGLAAWAQVAAAG